MPMLAVLLLAAPVTADAALTAYRARTAATIRCRSDASEVVVCARRQADRYRVPLVTPPEPGDPRHESVAAERERYFARTNQCQEKTSFLVGCGSVGVHMTAGAGGTRLSAGQRPLAP